MRHRQRDVGFVVKFARGEGDGRARNDFLDEDHAATPAVFRFAPDVHPQVHFFKVAMERNRDSKQPGLQKQEADHRDQNLSIPQIQFRSRGNKGRKRGRFDLAIEHRQMPPLCGQKHAGAGAARCWRASHNYFSESW